MELISAEERRRYIESFTREAVHLELRDNYATSGMERAKFAAWKAGKADDGDWLETWCNQVRAGVGKGKSYRRACVVSEPFSEYQRWGHSVRAVLTAAGEDIRLVPRRLLSAVTLPGNDFWMFDGEAVVFGIFDGADGVVERQLYTEPEVVKFCRDSFEAVWALSIPHRDYKPS